MPKRTIPISRLKVGMYVAGLDRSWFHTPFLRHSFLIQNEQEITALRQSGVTMVVVDTDLGRDVAEEREASKPLSTPSVPVSPTTAAPRTTNMTADNKPPAQAHRDPEPLLERPSPLQLAAHFSHARQQREQWLARAKTIFETTRATDLIEADEAWAIIDDVLKNLLERQAACLAVLGVGQLDATLQEHGLTVCTLALTLGKLIGFSDDRLRQLGLGALLHDIGLAKLPHHMIKRPKTMTPAQQSLYLTHTVEGRRILQKSRLTAPDLLSMISYHHQLEQPPETAANSMSHADVIKLISVVDQYDELLNGQTGLPPMSSSQALSHLYQRFQAHHEWQAMVSLLIRVIGIYPLYSVVSLTSGEVGIVAAISPGKAHLPYLYLCRDQLQRPCIPPIPLDLTQEPEGGRRVKEVLDPRRCGIDIEQVLEQAAA
jgi:HD-GYP domain-containing protein (c-di-GMP phosphodiesterase class II)